MVDFPTGQQAETSVFVVDDNPLSEAGLKALTARVFRDDHIRSLDSLETVIANAVAIKPSVFIINYQLRWMKALKLAAGVLKANPQAPILFAAMPHSAMTVMTALTVGIRGLLLYSDSEEQTIFAMQALGGGSAYFSPAVASIIAKLCSSGSLTAHSFFGLSDRELEILKRLSLGQTNQLIADDLKLTIRAVQSCRLRMARKLNLKSTAELVRFAYDQELLELDWRQ